MVTAEVSQAEGGAAAAGSFLERQLERRWPIVWSIAALGIALGAAGQAAGRLLWHDELFTLYGAGMSPGVLWHALSTGYDLQPPLGFLLTGLSINVLGDGLVTARLPALAGFVIGSLALGLFVRREAGAVAGTVAMLVPSITAAYDYAYEARPYGAVLGVSALALVAWQAAGRDRARVAWAVALAVLLAAAVSLHYYAVLIVLPLAAGEVARTLEERRVNVAVWLAMLAAALPLAAFAPLMSAAAEYGGMFWTRASPRQVPYTYRYFLLPVVLPLLVFVIAMIARATTARGSESQSLAPVPRRPALVVTLALLLLPFAGVALGAAVGGFRHRYVIATVLGVGAAAGMLLRPSRRGAVVFMCVVSLWVLGRSATHAVPLLGPAPEVLAKHTMLLRALQVPDLPVVVTNDALYTHLNHYGSPELRQRLLIVMPPAAPAAGRFQDSSERAMRALARWRQISLVEYADLARRTAPFFVYGDKHWLLVELRRDGARIELEGEGFGHTLLRVTPRAGISE